MTPRRESLFLPGFPIILVSAVIADFLQIGVFYLFDGHHHWLLLIYVNPHLPGVELQCSTFL